MSVAQPYAPATTRRLIRALERRRRHAAELADSLHAEIDDVMATQDLSDLIDEDGGYDPEAADQMVAVTELIEHEIRDIDDALARAARGELGLCVRCGDRIPLERLRAVPSTSWCVGCRRSVQRISA